MGAGIQVSDECAEPAGVAGHRVAEIQDCDLRERLLLAWAQGLQRGQCLRMLAEVESPPKAHEENQRNKRIAEINHDHS